MDFPPNILRRLFFSRPGLSSFYPMEASGSLVKTKQRQECWWGLHLYPGLFFFALLHPRNLREGPSVVEAFSSSLDVCGVNPAVARASKLLKCQCSHSHTSQPSFCHLLSPSDESRLCPPGLKKKKGAQWRGCFCTCLHSGGNSITCTLLWNWNWHLASHCFYWAALMCFQKGRCVCVPIWACAQCVHGCAGSFHSCVSVFVWCVSSLTGLEGEFLNFPVDSISFMIGWERARLCCLLKESRPLKLRWERREEKWSRIGDEPATVVTVVVLVMLEKTWPCQYYYNEREKLVKLLHLLAGVAWFWLHYDQLGWRKY